MQRWNPARPHGTLRIRPLHIPGAHVFYGITDLTTFILGTIFIVLLPGPNSLYVMSAAARWGKAAGYRGACGVFAGDLILMVLAATGTASLLRTTPELFMVIKYAGAAYLAWVGVGLVRSAFRNWSGRSAPEQVGAPVTQATSGAPKTFRTALLISLLNPKAILFFVSFFIQFVDPGYAFPGLSFLILGGIVQICSFLYLSTLIFAGAYLAGQFRRRHRFAATATGGIGALFVAFGAKLATATLS